MQAKEKWREKMGAIIYLILGYWATGQTIYKNKILIGTGQSIFFQRVAAGFLLGFILIPIASIRLILEIIINR